MKNQSNPPVDGRDGADDAGAGPHLVVSNRGLFAKTMGKSFKKRPVVRGVSLAIQRGEVVGLLGRNGAGKTTCFYIIMGLLPPDYGTIYLDGDDITDLPMYRRARFGAPFAQAVSEKTERRYQQPVKD